MSLTRFKKSSLKDKHLAQEREALLQAQKPVEKKVAKKIKRTKK